MDNESSFQHRTKMKPKYPLYGRCQLALVMLFSARVSALLIGRWSCGTRTATSSVVS